MPAEKERRIDHIQVAKAEDNQRAVWDRDPFHPANYEQAAGEVFISDMRPYTVQRNRSIQQKIGEGELREIGDREAQERTSAHEEVVQAQDQRRQAALETARTGSGVAVMASPPVTTAEPGSSGVTIPEAEQHDAEHPDDDDTAENPDATDDETTGTRRVRRPARSGTTPDR